MRMIDADAFREWWLENGENEYVYDTNAILDSIAYWPTITSPQIVYCQDCVHHEDGYTHWCNKWEHVCPDDSEFFCKFGRKKDD